MRFLSIMKIPSICLIAVAAVAALSPIASHGESVPEYRYRAFLAATPLTKELTEKVRISTKLSSDSKGDLGIDYKIHNGLTDQVVVGIVFSVKSKDPSTGKEQTMDYQVDCEDTLPLHTNGGEFSLLQPFEGRFQGSVVTIKEIRTRKLVP